MKKILNRQFITKAFPFLFLVVFSALLFRKVFTQQLYPFPGNLLVTFFYPWQHAGWEGYDPYTSSKGFLAADAIRQDIPWRYTAFEQIKKGGSPLWNPYSFSGTPLLANLQSAILYPVNLFFLVLPFFDAWMFHIAIAPLLGSLFMYIYLREVGHSKGASLFGGLSLFSSSYLLVWLEIGIVAHTAIWFPTILWGIEKYQKTKKLRYWLILVLISVTTVFAGYFQMATHTLAIAVLYWLMLLPKKDLKKKYLLFAPLFLWIIATVLLTTAQVLPTYELKKLSPLTQPFVKDVYKTLKTPWINITTIFAPDILGNPATGNFISDIYGEGTPFVTALTPFLALAALSYKRRWRTWFWTVIGIVYLFYGFPGPTYYLVDWLKIDLLTGTLSSRGLIVFIFASIFLSAEGFDKVYEYGKKHQIKQIVISQIFPLIILLSLTTIALADWKFSFTLLFDSSQAYTALRNLAMPVVIVGASIASGVGYYYFPKAKYFSQGLVILLISYHGLYQANKILPFSPKEFFFPDHQLLQQATSKDLQARAASSATASVEKSFAPMYNLYSPEGYDTLRINRYAKLFAAQENEGSVPEVYSKSDADFSDKNIQGKVRLMNLTSVGYLFDKNEADRDQMNEEPYKFPEDSVSLEWVWGPFRVYSRDNFITRASLYRKYQVESDSDLLLKQLYSDDFRPESTLLLEEDPQISFEDPSINEQESVSIISDSGSKLTLKTDTLAASLLLLTDADYPGWKAFVNGAETPIHRANYAFRAIKVPAGESQVTFIYDPLSFKLGVWISFVTLILIVISTTVLVRTKRVAW